MIGKILLSLLIGCLVGGAAYLVLGALRRDDSDVDRGQSVSSSKKVKRKRPTGGDDDHAAGKGPDSGLAPTKEWFGGFRE